MNFIAERNSALNYIELMPVKIGFYASELSVINVLKNKLTARLILFSIRKIFGKKIIFFKLKKKCKMQLKTAEKSTQQLNVLLFFLLVFFHFDTFKSLVYFYVLKALWC